LFEPPAFDVAPPAPDSSSKDREKNAKVETADPLQSTLGKNGDKTSYIERLDKFLQGHLLNLNIYGQIKTICPSEFFLCNMLEKDQKFKSAHLIKMDHSIAENTYSVDVSPLSSRTNKGNLFAPH